MISIHRRMSITVCVCALTSTWCRMRYARWSYDTHKKYTRFHLLTFLFASSFSFLLFKFNFQLNSISTHETEHYIPFDHIAIIQFGIWMLSLTSVYAIEQIERSFECRETQTNIPKKRDSRFRLKLNVQWFSIFHSTFFLFSASHIRFVSVMHHILSTSINIRTTDTDDLVQMEANHYERQSQQRGGNQQPKSINTLNMINSVLLRKTALSKLSR